MISPTARGVSINQIEWSQVFFQQTAQAFHMLSSPMRLDVFLLVARKRRDGSEGIL
jgi:hypothetical protein